jgi:hypothetical protein
MPDIVDVIVMRVIAPLSPKHCVLPSGPGIHGPLPPTPASATYRAPSGPKVKCLGLSNPLAITSREDVDSGVSTSNPAATVTIIRTTNNPPRIDRPMAEMDFFLMEPSFRFVVFKVKTAAR